MVNLTVSLQSFGRIFNLPKCICLFYLQLLAINFLFPRFILSIYLYLNPLADRRHTTSRNAIRHKLLLVRKAIFPIDMCQRQENNVHPMQIKTQS